MHHYNFCLGSILIFTIDTMKTIFLACVLLGLASSCFAAEEFDLENAESSPRLFFNTTGTASTLSLLGAAILITVIAFLVFSNVSAGSSYYNRNDYDNYDPYGDAYYGQYR